MFLGELRKRCASSLRVRLTLQLLAVAAVALAAVTLIGWQVAAHAEQNAIYQETEQLIAKQAARFNGQAQVDQSVSRDLAAIAVAGRGDSRARIVDMVGQVGREHPGLLSTFVGFEPNAFDGHDAAYRKRGIYDATGRFGVYWDRIDGPFTVSSLTAPGDGWDSDWYTIPKKRRTDVVMEPYFDTGVMETTYIAPIMEGTRFLGIAGADVRLTALSQQMSKVKVLNSGYAFVISHRGLLVTSPKTQWIGKKHLVDLGHGSNATVLARVTRDIQAGRSGYVDAQDPVSGRPAVLFYTPMSTGGWGFIAVAPKAEILADSHRLELVLLLLGLATLLALGGALVAQRGAPRAAGGRSKRTSAHAQRARRDRSRARPAPRSLGGNLTLKLRPVTTPAPVTRRDEIGNLAEHSTGCSGACSTRSRATSRCAIP